MVSILAVEMFDSGVCMTRASIIEPIHFGLYEGIRVSEYIIREELFHMDVLSGTYIFFEDEKKIAVEKMQTYTPKRERERESLWPRRLTTHTFLQPIKLNKKKSKGASSPCQKIIQLQRPSAFLRV